MTLQKEESLIEERMDNSECNDFAAAEGIIRAFTICVSIYTIIGVCWYYLR